MNPNGLTDEQIAARPEPFVGMLAYGPVPVAGDSFFIVSDDEIKFTKIHWNHILLPGEPGCPWPPPEEFRHEWKEGDRAWVISHSKNNWVEAVYGDGSLYCKAGPLVFEIPGDTPAIYIPD